MIAAKNLQPVRSLLTEDYLKNARFRVIMGP
jgi:hypothetical protein